MVYNINMETKRIRNFKRILFEVSDEMYADIKASCKRRGISMRLFMTRAIKNRLDKEKNYK